MHIVVKTVDVGPVEAVIVVATDENLVPIRQVAEPVEKIKSFPFAPDHTEIARMDYYIGLGQIPQPPMTAMSIREMENLHAFLFANIATK